MPLPYKAKFVKCPFYCKHDNNRIVCEGLAVGSNLNMTFVLPADCAKYMSEVCYDLLGCRDCPIYIMLDQKYEEGEDGQYNR